MRPIPRQGGDPIERNYLIIVSAWKTKGFKPSIQGHRKNVAEEEVCAEAGVTLHRTPCKVEV